MSSRTRRPLVVANWKMNLTERGAAALTAELLARLRPSEEGTELAFAPSFPCLRAVADLLAGTPVGLAAQDLHDQDAGPFTGEVSPLALAEMGVRSVLVGHSERRLHFGEDDGCVGRKLLAAQRHGLVPILCVGETKAERDEGRTLDVVLRQLRLGFGPVPSTRLVVAYEPVWAIGTGEVANPEQVEQVHRMLRDQLATLAGRGAAGAVRILYGGSVTAKNARGLLQLPDVDGALVGGASLDAEAFDAIVRAAS